MQLDEYPFVILAEKLLLNVGRSGVYIDFSIGIESLNDSEILRNDIRELTRIAQKPDDAVLCLSGLLSHGVIQSVDAASGMGVYDGERLVLLPDVGNYGAQDEMFQDIRVVSGMKAMSVA